MAALERTRKTTWFLFVFMLGFLVELFSGHCHMAWLNIRSIPEALQDIWGDKNSRTVGVV